MGAKIVIVVLVVLLIAYVVVMRHGATRSGPDETAPSDPSQAKSYQTQGWTKKLGGLLAQYSPKLKLEQPGYNFGSISVEVPASQEKFRNATFRIVQGCVSTPPPNQGPCDHVHINYNSKNGEGHDLQLDNQPWQGSQDDPRVGSLLILEGGGRLTFTCDFPLKCRAELQ